MSIQEKIIIYERKYICCKADHKYIKALYYYLKFVYFNNKHKL